MTNLSNKYFVHREISYQPEDLRLKRKFLYILTDVPTMVNADLSALTDGVVSNLDTLSDDTIANSAFYVYFTRSDYAVPFLRKIIKNKGLFAPPPDFTKKSFESHSGTATLTYDEAAGILQGNMFGERECQMQICQAVEITKNVPGDFVEIGVYSGSSALIALVHMKNLGIQRNCWLLDTYAGFNYEAAKSSSDMIWDNTHQMDADKTIERIINLTANVGYKVNVVANEICSQELPVEIQKVALAHVDVDMYEAVLAALTKLGPLMQHKGIIVVDDAAATPGLYGAYVAMMDFLETEIGSNFICVQTTTKHFLIRT